MYHWKKGISLSFFQNNKGESIGMEPEVFHLIQKYGIGCVELSFSKDDYFEKYHFTEKDNAERLYEFSKALGIELWSIHLPFSTRWDLSGENTLETFRIHMELIKAASRAHISVAVLHPSFEPVLPQERAERILCAKKQIRTLRQEAEKYGVVLAIENLPRTCLGNSSEEMIDLLDATGAKFIFDTNHSLEEDNIHFLKNMIKHNYCPVSLHISDYDFLDERHELPGCGKNSWNLLLETLYQAGYEGPALYEIASGVTSGKTITLKDLSENMEILLAGKIN